MATASGTLLHPGLPRGEWNTTQLGQFVDVVEEKYGRSFSSYDEVWQWSVDEQEEFWESVWDFCQIITHAPYSRVLADARMPGAQWFPGARLNYAEHIVRGLKKNLDKEILIARSQTTEAFSWTGRRLLREIEAVRTGLVAAGITRGDRVVGYLPNIPQTIATYIATVSIGAIWSSVPPEMGPQSVIDRVQQLQPSLLIAIDGYRWGAKIVDRAEELQRIREALPQTKMVLLPYLNTDCETPDGAIRYSEFTAEAQPLEFEAVAFDHPLIILFSSGTTGKPKAIVHCHGGVLLEHFKQFVLMFDISEKERSFWYSTTGWMVWNLSVSNLLVGASMVLMDGDPGWPALDGEWSQWAIVAGTTSTYMTTGSAYLAACAHAEMKPGELWDLSQLREIQCSGSALSPDVAAWVYSSVNGHLHLAEIAGGTDICSGFVGGSPVSPVYAGEMSVRLLGTSVYAWGPDGTPVQGEPGELVCTKPLPSMPVSFWGDESGKRYHDSYFDTWPGVWRHGDWLVHTDRNAWNILGRSDATLNRGGVRLGTAEFYAVLDRVSELSDSMVLHFEAADGGMGVLVLLAVAKGEIDRVAVERTLRTLIRTELSPRHVPDVVVWVPSVPRTATGKRLEIPLKRLVQGVNTGNTIDRGVLVHPEDLDGIVEAINAVI